MALRPPVFAALAGLVTLAGCASNLGDPRTQALLEMPVPEFYGQMRVARELTGQCPRYGWNSRLSKDLGAERSKQGRGAEAAARQTQAVDLEAQLKRRSLSAVHDGKGACEILDGEVARQTPLSVMVVAGG